LLRKARGVRQVLVELREGYLAVMAAGDGALLTVLADEDANVDQVAYEMGLLVKRVPGYLSVPSRAQSAGAGGQVQ
jgi:uncharacterized protein